MLLITRKHQEEKVVDTSSVAITAEMLDFITGVAEDTDHTRKEIAMLMLEYARKHMVVAPDETRTLEEIKASPEFLEAQKNIDTFLEGGHIV